MNTTQTNKATNIITTEYDDSHTFSGLPAPAHWHVIDRKEDGLMWQRLAGEAIKVIESIEIKSDGRRWLHVSVSKPSKKKLATYEDVEVARRLFIGNGRECYMIFPPADRYVNVNPVLHLWCCLDAPEGVLPHMEGVREIPVPIEVRGAPQGVTFVEYREQLSV